LLPRDCSAPTIATLPRKEQRLVLGKRVLVRPQQQLAWQIGMCRADMGRPAGFQWFLQIGQQQNTAAHIARAQRQDLADTSAGRPQSPQQQPVALTGGGSQHGLGDLGGQRRGQWRGLFGGPS
jgi:hypothetical protein